MKFLIDTNVLLRIAQLASSDHIVAKSAVVQLVEEMAVPCIVPQVIYEFWVAATRPEAVN